MAQQPRDVETWEAELVQLNVLVTRKLRKEVSDAAWFEDIPRQRWISRALKAYVKVSKAKCEQAAKDAEFDVPPRRG